MIDLGEAVEVGSVAVRDAGAARRLDFFGPTEISVGLSDDGKTFRTVASEKYPVAGRNASEIVENRLISLRKTRWVKVGGQVPACRAVVGDACQRCSAFLLSMR